MAIKIGGTTTIDDNRNVSGYIGTFTGLNINLLPTIFNPSIGQTNVGVSTNIILTFNQTVGISSTTANITIRRGSASGVAIATIGVTSSSVTINGSQVTIDPPVNLGFTTTYYPVIDAGAFKNSFGNVSTALTTYYFTTESFPDLGGTFEGGRVICKSGGTAWIVAPSSSELVSSSWYVRNNAVTNAQACTGVSGWFVPTCGQLQNPGYVCRTYWDSYSTTTYWSDTQFNDQFAFRVYFSSGGAALYQKGDGNRVRAFRCVTY